MKGPVKTKKRGCQTKWCRGTRALHRRSWTRKNGTVKTAIYRLALCWKCRSRQLKERHVETYVLNAIRQRAKKRGIKFTLTLEQFRKFCFETRYIELRGRKPTSLTIDRIDPDKGYSIDNIRVLSFLENCRRQDDPPEEEHPF